MADVAGGHFLVNGLMCQGTSTAIGTDFCRIARTPRTGSCLSRCGVLLECAIYPRMSARRCAFGCGERAQISESHRLQTTIEADGTVVIADIRGEQQLPQPGAVTHLIKIRVPHEDAHFERAYWYGARGLPIGCGHPCRVDAEGCRSSPPCPRRPATVRRSTPAVKSLVAE